MGENTQKEPTKLYTLAQVAEHTTTVSCWMVISDKVYDFTNFLIGHPGGEDIILEHAGHDATQEFDDKGHSEIATELLVDYLIGELVEKDRRKK